MYTFRLAQKNDLAAILELYHAIIGTPGCTWSLEYPAEENVLEDIEDERLYCMEEDSGRIIAVAAAGNIDELGELQWDERITVPCELARIGTHPSAQGKGIGTKLLSNVLAACREKGYDGMRFLVSKTNYSAMALYRKFGFSECGETFMFGHDYYCYQKVFIAE